MGDIKSNTGRVEGKEEEIEPSYPKIIIITCYRDIEDMLN